MEDHAHVAGNFRKRFMGPIRGSKNLGARKRNTCYGATEDKHHGPCTGQQGNAPLGHRLQLEEVPQIRPKIYKKWGGNACFDRICEKGRPTSVFGFTKASKIDFSILIRQEKNPLKRLILIRFFRDQCLVQRLALLATGIIFELKILSQLKQEFSNF